MPGNAKSMVISMIVVAAVVLAWLAFTPRVSSVSQPVVDINGVAREIGNGQHWDVAVAAGLGDRWQPVNVRLLNFDGQPATWQAGYDGPGSAYAAVLQTKSGDQSWVAAQVQNGAKVGTVTIGGQAWTRYDNESIGQKGLARADALGGLSTVVIGKSTSWDQLQTFAGSLKPLSRAQGSAVAK